VLLQSELSLWFCLIVEKSIEERRPLSRVFLFELSEMIVENGKRGSIETLLAPFIFSLIPFCMEKTCEEWRMGYICATRNIIEQAARQERLSWNPCGSLRLHPRTDDASSQVRPSGPTVA